MGLLSDVEEYLEALERNGSSFQTQKNYRAYLHKFLDFISGYRLPNQRRLTRTEEINQEIIRAYRINLNRYVDPLTDQPYRKSTQNYHLIALRQFLRYLNEKARTGPDYRQIALHDHPLISLPVIAKEDFFKLLKAVDLSDEEGLRDRAILVLLFSTGLKLSQLSGLNREDIQITVEDARLTIPASVSRIKLDALAKSAVSSYLSARHDVYRPLFIRYKGEVNPENLGERMRLTPRSIERMFKKYRKLTRLKVEITPQVLRHSFALNLLSEGADQEEVKKALGLASDTSLKRYIRFGASRERKEC